jgi:outer membrane protein OmpA-like peptidoglycan-associated protein
MYRYFSWSVLFVGLLVFKSQAQQLTETVITIYFNSGQFKCKLQEEKKLLTTLNNKEFIVGEISGFTDTVGSVKENLILSRRRSVYVNKLLRDHFNVLTIYPVRYYGETRPTSLLDNSQNRRVEISLGVLKKE